MTTFALNNLWTYLQGLSLSQSDREWLANKLIMPKEATPELTAEERKARFLRLAGIWSDDSEGEEFYQMMKHRNDEPTPEELEAHLRERDEFLYASKILAAKAFARHL